MAKGLTKGAHACGRFAETSPELANILARSLETRDSARAHANAGANARTTRQLVPTLALVSPANTRANARAKASAHDRANARAHPTFRSEFRRKGYTYHPTSLAVGAEEENLDLTFLNCRSLNGSAAGASSSCFLCRRRALRGVDVGGAQRSAEGSGGDATSLRLW